MLEEVGVIARLSSEISVSKQREGQEFGQGPNTVLFIETDFEPAPIVKVLSAIPVMSYRAFIFSKDLA